MRPSSSATTPGSGRGRQPAARIHDFRHRFAVQTLLDWYRSGVDVQPLMPQLSTYLGHTQPSDSYWYLTAAPELLELAAERLQQIEGRRS